MFDGYMALDGVELVNNERYATMAAALGLPTLRRRCATLRQVLADDPYTAVNAPWADTATPEATGFAGFFVSTTTGLNAATATREVTDTAGDTPAVPGPIRSGPRTILVTAFTAATSPAALAYGLQWLRTVLHDGDPCTGGTLCMLAECPACDVATGPAADTCWAATVRTLHDVVCIDGPRVIAQQSVPGCAPRGVSATIEFTLIAAAPHIYRDPQTLASALTFTDPAPDASCEIDWLPVGAGRGNCPVPVPCEPVSSRLVDPLAAPLPVLPTVPVRAGACITRTRSAYALATAAAGLLPRWLDSVPVITVRAGDADLRRLTISFHPNPRLLTIAAPADLDPCGALAEINLTYLPADAELVLDGRARQAYVRSAGGIIERADSVLYGPGGGPWTWPVLTCAGALTVVALVDAEHHSAAASIDVALAARQDIA